ncbi:cell division protein FtsA [Thermocrinis sp.]
MIYTGLDGSKSFSISYSPLRKRWYPTHKQGRRICVVPSDLCFVKMEKAFSKKPSQIRDYYSIEVLEKFGKLPWDVALHGDNIILGVYKNFRSEGCYSVDLEVFSLARVLKLLGVDGYVLDLGRRKTTLVRVEGGLLKSYRVVLRGGDYLSRLINPEDPEEGERLKKEKGLEIKQVYEGLKGILSSLNLEEDVPVLLSGGGANLKGIKDLFKKLIKNPHCEPIYTSAFGASLKFVLKTPYPDFVERELSPQEIKTVGVLLLGGFFLFGFSYFGMERLWSVERLREREKTEFKKLFPNAPTAGIRQQVLSKATREDPFQLTVKLSELSPKLKEGMKIYSFEFSDGSLLVKGEGEESKVREINPKLVKKTPSGTLEFELEIK